MAAVYKFHLVCPRCNKYSETIGDKYTRNPGLNCGDCLFNDVEFVEMRVIAIDRPYGKGIIRDRMSH